MVSEKEPLWRLTGSSMRHKSSSFNSRRAGVSLHSGEALTGTLIGVTRGVTMLCVSDCVPDMGVDGVAQGSVGGSCTTGGGGASACTAGSGGDGCLCEKMITLLWFASVSSLPSSLSPGGSGYNGFCCLPHSAKSLARSLPSICTWEGTLYQLSVPWWSAMSCRSSSQSLGCSMGPCDPCQPRIFQILAAPVTPR